MQNKTKSKRKPRETLRPSKTPAAPSGAWPIGYYELEVIPGLAEFAQTELQQHTDNRVRLVPSAREDRVPFDFAGDPRELLQLRRSVAVNCVKRFDIPRPKALLGHQNFEQLIGMVKAVLALHSPGGFKTFHISAAGSGSSVFARIKAEIQTRTGLEYTEEVGDLLLTVRRPSRFPTGARNTAAGWEVAVRLSPRPLSARPWRVCDMPGALNGAVANTMMSLTDPEHRDRVINLACGSGTLLIERLVLQSVRTAVGCDVDVRALTCARENLVASGYAGPVTLVRCDAGRVPLPTGWATTVCADLPFGMLVGSHQSNKVLYPRLLTEAGRLTVVAGKLVVITQELRLFERTVAAHEEQWQVTRVIPIKLPANTRAGYIQPRIYLLRRR
jgi:tRNA (guanine6-N2)-methyltransferase